MRPFLLAFFAWLPNILCDPTLDDNKLPTDEEVLKDLLGRQGQPEEEASLGLPTDEESFNELKSFLLGTNSGTHHFVAASFPEIDARGFHESVFNGVGDYFSSWPRKRTVSDDIYPVQMMTNEELGIIHPLRDRSDFRQASYNAALRRAQSGLHRGKRQLPSLVQSCSLPGITCDPISQNGAETTETSTATSATVVASELESDTNSTKVETTTAPAPTELILPISTRYLIKRSISSSSGNIGPESVIIGKDGGNKHHGLPTLHRLLKQKGLTSEDSANRMMTVNLILSKLLAELKARRHLKRTLLKRKPEMTASGFHADTFNRGFGDFDVMKRKPEMSSSGFHGDTFNGGFGDFDVMKRRPEMSSSGFHSDTFNGGFGDFDVMKRRPEMSSAGFHGDAFTGGFGEFDVMKRKPEMSSSGFHGDTFNGGFGDFDVMKRRPEMSSSGFHGDTFNGGFGDFDVMKRRPEMSSSGFHADTFNGGFGDFDVMKRKPEMSSSGFHADTFNGGFGDFDIMKRKPEMTSSGFHDDTFHGGFGDFDIMKREISPSSSRSVKRYREGKHAHHSIKEQHNKDFSHKSIPSNHLKFSPDPSLHYQKPTKQR